MALCTIYAIFYRQQNFYYIYLNCKEEKIEGIMPAVEYKNEKNSWKTEATDYLIQRNDKYNDNLTDFGKAVLADRYLLEDETFQDLFIRVATYYGDNKEHSQRLYDYIGKLWFMPSTPVLSNGGSDRGLPISCYLNEIEDSLDGIVNKWNENVWLASRGGGIGTYWGNVRSIGEKVKYNGKTSGIIPFICVQDSMTLAISQGSLRRGSAAMYLQIDHPEIEEFIDLRRPTGGDPNRKALNIHHGVVITDAFMHAVEQDADWELKSPKTKETMSVIKARELWIKLLLARIETGEPYILFIDRVNENIPLHHKKLGLNVKMSNLCSEITLPTGKDHLGNDRTAVCCLSSLNLETYEEWQHDGVFIEDVMRFLDNVLQDYIEKAPESMANAKYAASRERSVGLGVMGFHSFLQKNMIPFESVMSKVWNKKIFEYISKQANLASKKIAEEKGACPDAAECGIMERFSNKTAIAPTASISVICGNSSPGIEPYAANSFTQKTLSGSFTVRNKNLKELLAAKNMDTDSTWSSISTHEGSVQQLEFLNQEEKDVFKTAQEIDQRWVIELAADRTKYIDQAQSVNLFVKGNISKRDLHKLHFDAWKKGMKSLYYCRSVSLQRADKVSHKIESHQIEFNQIGDSLPTRKAEYEDNKYEECLACQ
jgi:ribonucleoside-diphosphate reductase alpha chain